MEIKANFEDGWQKKFKSNDPPSTTSTIVVEGKDSLPTNKTVKNCYLRILKTSERTTSQTLQKKRGSQEANED